MVNIKKRIPQNKSNTKEHNQKIKDSLATPIHCVDLNITFKSCGDAAKYVGLKCTGDIHQIAKGIGNSKTAGGYTWKYVT